MNEKCEVCKVNDFKILCDYGTGSGFITSIDFQEIVNTCDKKLCRQCAVNIWANGDVCPGHATVIQTNIMKAKR